MPEINPITLALPFGLGTVNCYLIKAEAGYVLIDTGSSNRRAALEQALIKAGCQSGNLKLIVLTHGDFDHTGNAAYLRQTFSAPLAMHPDDFSMLERGDMFASRDYANPMRKKSPPPEIVTHYLASSFIALLTWWLDNDSTYTAEQMNDYYLRLVQPGIEAIFQ